MSNEQELPKIFDGTRFIMPAAEIIETLSEGHRTALEAIRTAVEHDADINAKLADAIATVKDATAELAELEQYANQHFPKVSFHDLWRQNFGR